MTPTLLLRAKPFLGTVLLTFCLRAAGAEFTPEGIEFFEKRIRPVLVERCYKCHSADSEKLKGGLRLDSRAALLQGGESGKPAVTPGDPAKSRLLEAVRYENPDLQMPPKAKLSAEQIADLTQWVKLGAPWPQESTRPTARKKEFNLEQRRQSHWCWQPIRTPALPRVQDAAWPAQPPDRFILAKLEANGLRPAAPANPRTLLRRLCFDLTGLPPTPAEVAAFVNDPSPDAYERVVDRLLDSPHFGERWARHWLDLVRYAETLGHEFDYARHNAWRYRDYVIRAFNADVPYDRFVIEHLAGDLLENPRRHPTEKFNESIIGTGFFWLGQQTHSPVDVRLHQAEVIDNQVDVMTKTFLGLTVACARCHDHKFDAIATKDFYACYGMIASSRYAQRTINAPAEVAPKVERLKALKPRIRAAAGAAWAKQANQIKSFLLAADEVAHGEFDSKETNRVEAVAARRQLDARQLARWIATLDDQKISEPAHPFHVWREWVRSGAQVEALRSSVAAHRTNDVLFADFDHGRFADWMPDGDAFDGALHEAGEFMVGDARKPVARVLIGPGLNSGVWSRRLQGAIRSPTFTITNRYLHVLAAGRDSRLNVVICNYTLIQDPIYGGLRRVFDGNDPHWLTIDLAMWPGQRAYLEFCDNTSADPAGGGKPAGYSADGWLSLEQVIFSEHSVPPSSSRIPLTVELLSGGKITSLETLAGRYQDVVRQAVQWWTSPADAAGKLSETSARDFSALQDTLVQHGLLRAENDPLVAKLVSEYNEIEAAIPEAMLVPAMADGTGLDEAVFLRGNPKTPGEVAPRRFLEAIAGPAQAPFRDGSGRREFARRITDPSNPFLARVMANRVWLHLFGRGIVPTPDDFGVLGQPPTHPELLDWLANYFRADARWSAKQLIRLLVTSRTYRMASEATDTAAEEEDRTNTWWHRMNVRRLEGEAIRDAVLAVSGRLDPKMFGPSVPIHLTEFMDGRGKPAVNGPLDGDGRRSLYVEVRRNFLSPMLLAFDTPTPFTTIGRRTSSNVPAQALILMNDPLIAQQAQWWAKRLLEDPTATPSQRVIRVYEGAFGRPPSRVELDEALAFLKTQGQAYGGAEAGSTDKAWADLCHVMFNVKEFVFVN